MPTQDDVRRLALALTEATEDRDHFGFRVDGKQFAWAWNKRVDPKGARVPQPDVLVVRVANELEKQSLLSLDTSAFFTEPHYNGYPAVLVRLQAIDLDLLEKLLTDAGVPRHPSDCWQRRLAARLRGRGARRAGQAPPRRRVRRRRRRWRSPTALRWGVAIRERGLRRR